MTADRRATFTPGLRKFNVRGGGPFSAESRRFEDSSAMGGADLKSDVFRVPREVWTDFQTLGEDITESRWYQIIVSSIVGGSYICFGATLSLFLSAGVSALGPAEFLLGIGFIAGFSMVILSGSLLFTEVNIILPAFFIKSWLRACLSCFFFWGLTWIGNLIGILATATFINLAGVVTPEVADRLREVLQSKLTSFVIGGGRVVSSGALWSAGKLSRGYSSDPGFERPNKYVHCRWTVLPCAHFRCLGRATQSCQHEFLFTWSHLRRYLRPRCWSWLGDCIWLEYYSG